MAASTGRSLKPPVKSVAHFKCSRNVLKAFHPETPEESVAELKVRVVEGDLVLEDGALLVAETGLAEVKGRVLCRGAFTVRGSLRAKALTAGDARVEGDLEVEGEVEASTLYVEGSLKAERVEIESSCTVGKLAKAETFSVGGSLKSEELEAERVSVGGWFRAKEARAGRVSVGGSLEVEKLEAGRVDVGGVLRGGKVAAEALSVGGSIEVREIEAGKVSVGGTFSLETGRVERIEVGGMLRAQGPLAAGRVSVGGSARVERGFKSEEIDVGGFLELPEGGEVVGRLSVGGTLEAGGILKAGRLVVGGDAEVEKVVAREVKISRLQAKIGVKAEEFTVSRRGRVKGVVAAKRFFMERDSSADTVYAEVFDCEERCRVRELYTVKARIGTGSVVEKAYYVESLEAEEGAKVGKAEKIAEIKPPEGFAL